MAVLVVQEIGQHGDLLAALRLFLADVAEPAERRRNLPVVDQRLELPLLHLEGIVAVEPLLVVEQTLWMGEDRETGAGSRVGPLRAGVAVVLEELPVRRLAAAAPDAVGRRNIEIALQARTGGSRQRKRAGHQKHRQHPARESQLANPVPTPLRLR